MQFSKLVLITVVCIVISFCSDSVQPARADKNSSYFELTITGQDGEQRVYSSKSLLEHPDIRTVTFEGVPGYKNRMMTFKVIRLADLMEGIPVSPDATIQFFARDNFASPLEAERALNTGSGGSVAYLAIEGPGNKWPPLQSKEDSAGPFYLVWENPELSDIGREEWPYMVDRIVVLEPASRRYAAINPEGRLGSGHLAAKGFKVFVKHCIACHKLNRIGSATKDPDLNYPMSPVEYFRNGVLKKFIRDPQSVRLFPGSNMVGFSKDVLSDAELNQLIAYFGYMSERNKDD